MLCSQYLMTHINKPLEKPLSARGLMHRAGFMESLAEGPYLWTPLGTRVVQKTIGIIRDELKKLHGLEIILSASQGARPASQIIEFLGKQIRSYKQLPKILYQDSEIYSFHTDIFKLEELNQQLLQALKAIFCRLQLQDFTQFSYTKQEISITVLLADSKAIKLQMGYYHLTLIDLLTAIVNQHQDEHGIIWPENIAPFQIGIIPLQFQKSYRVRQAAEQLFQQLQNSGFEVLMDDRKERPGLLFAEMDLLGIPHRLLITERGLDAGTIEYKNRRSGAITSLKLENILTFFKA